ncbi:MAG: Gfo/Idh/MocA family oxidoreductase [Sphingobacteriaceae bacterium]|nr:Gfo/Idh/MocA family oxidoreductase [Sphingobacteriaceae bacterium]
MPNNLILVGTGPMGVEYAKVLNALGTRYIAVGRGENSAKEFFNKTGIEAVTGGLRTYLTKSNEKPDCAIVAVGVDQLYETTCVLINNGIKEILLEKPGGVNGKEISELSKLAKENDASVYLAYNRRFYASALEAAKYIELDGGLKSMQFDFTEWSHVIEKLNKPVEIKQNWLLANSTHVIDLAFYFGGNPKTMSSVSSGKLTGIQNQFSPVRV